MIDTERSLETVARLHAEIMRERAEGLHEAAQTAKTRLVAREEALARLRGQVALLKASLNPAPAPRAVRVAPSPIPVPEKEAVLNSARITTASLPRTVNWQSFAPYAAIVACAVFLEIGGARRPASAAPNLTALLRPAPAVVANSRPAAKGAPIVVDDDRSQEAMLLVHEWKLPGDEKSLGERLGGEFELPGGRPSWSVERTGAKGYRVTFQAAEKDLPYAFEADIESRVVWPTPETQELLAPRFTAAFRDAVR
jgi:hypothetical protein